MNPIRNRPKLALPALCLILGFSLSAYAQGGSGYVDSGVSSVEVKAIRTASSSEPNTCVAFEAEFSKPLAAQPKAFLHIQQVYNTIVSALLKVTKIGSNKYALSLVASDPGECPSFNSDQSALVTVSGAMGGSDQREVLPQEREFSSKEIAASSRSVKGGVPLFLAQVR